MGHYIVRRGDTLSKIATRYDISWKQLYNHPLNEELRELRPNPNHIRPGDELWVPNDDDPYEIISSSPVVGDDVPESDYLSPPIFKGGPENHKYRVRPGDTLESIARNEGFIWETLWSDGNNQALREKAKEPESVREGDVVHIPDLIPKRESAATDKAHRYTRKGLPLRTEPFEIILENLEELRLPFVEYKVTFNNGEMRTGVLDQDGYVLLEESPPGEVEILFADHADMVTKSLAACASKAFSVGDQKDVFKMLKESAETLQLAIEAYDAFFNSNSGRGFVHDVYQEFKNDDALLLVEALLALGGVEVEAQHEFIESEPQDQGHDEFYEIDETDETDEVDKIAMLYEESDSSSPAEEEEYSEHKYVSLIDDELTSLMDWDGNPEMLS